jgi:nitrite reductase/ring-hydroxylating ferredoxin subunit
VPPAQVGDIQAGNVDQLPVGSLVVVGTEAVCIGRDTGGIYAMTLTCTHAGCDIGETGSVSPQGLFCGCHGSEFDANGNVVRGPARQPLDHFDVTADDAGNLTIHGSQVVEPESASERMKSSPARKDPEVKGAELAQMIAASVASVAVVDASARADEPCARVVAPESWRRRRCPVRGRTRSPISGSRSRTCPPPIAKR